MWVVWFLPATPANPVPLTCVVIPRCFPPAPEWRRWIFWRQLAVAVEQRSVSGAAWTQLDWETSQLWQRWQLAAVAGPGSSWAARNLAAAPQGMNQVFELEGCLEQSIKFKTKLNLRLKNLVCVEKNRNPINKPLLTLQQGVSSFFGLNHCLLISKDWWHKTE